MKDMSGMCRRKAQSMDTCLRRYHRILGNRPPTIKDPHPAQTPKSTNTLKPKTPTPPEDTCEGRYLRVG